MVQPFRFLVLFICIEVMMLFSMPSFAIEPYGDLGLGVAIHVIDDLDEAGNKTSSEGASSQLIKGAFGVRWFSFFSTQVGLWYWDDNLSFNNSTYVDSTESRSDDGGEEKSPSFEGLGASIEATLQWPVVQVDSKTIFGPYYRLGQHCWSAIFTGLERSWSKDGCSRLQTFGFSFPPANSYENKAAAFIELTKTDLEDVTTTSLHLGFRLPL